MSRKAGLQYYIKMCSKASKIFACPECRKPMLAKEYEAHCTRYHRLDAKIQCVWCHGATSWPKGEKQYNAQHLRNCFKTFLGNQSDNKGSTLDSTDVYGIDRYHWMLNHASPILSCSDCTAVMQPTQWEDHCLRSNSRLKWIIEGAEMLVSMADNNPMNPSQPIVNECIAWV